VPKKAEPVKTYLYADKPRAQTKLNPALFKPAGGVVVKPPTPAPDTQEPPSPKNGVGAPKPGAAPGR